MSWSFNAIGKPTAVAKKARTDLEAIKCSEPEQTIKANVIDTIERVCVAMPDTSAVKVEAFGSQSQGYDAATGRYLGDKVNNSLSLKIEPIYGFVE